jgi:antagonist of KipI
MIHVIKPGLLTTVQDMGRRGFTHLGLSPGGAADSVAFRLANLVAGNYANAPALEITLLGPTLELEVEATIAICGSRTSTSQPVNEPIRVAAGERLIIGSLLDGARAYLAVRGGIAVPGLMGSCSTFLPAKIGGFQGRALQTGDRLPLGTRTPRDACKLSSATAVLLQQREGNILVTRSLQSDWFDKKVIRQFHEQPFTVTSQSNRSGLRLSGQPIAANRSDELVTEGIPLGAIQVPPDGLPIILFVDQQTTGGYPKIANVIAAHLPRIAQLRPGDEVRFQQTVIAEAIARLRNQENVLREAFAQ